MFFAVNSPLMTITYASEVNYELSVNLTQSELVGRQAEGILIQ